MCRSSFYSSKRIRERTVYKNFDRSLGQQLKVYGINQVNCLFSLSDQNPSVLLISLTDSPQLSTSLMQLVSRHSIHSLPLEYASQFWLARKALSCFTNSPMSRTLKKSTARQVSEALYSWKSDMIAQSVLRSQAVRFYQLGIFIQQYLMQHKQNFP